MDKTTIKFGNIEIGKQHFTNLKDLFQLKLYVLIK